MSLFSNSNNTVISAYNLTMTAVSGTRTSDPDEKTRLEEKKIRKGFKIICQNTTPPALDGSDTSDPAKYLGCLHGTRLGVRDYIVYWLNDPYDTAAMWMYGPAGIGKTAIAQTIAKLCQEQQRLSSAFFFFRSDEGRNSTEKLGMTLAYGMLQQMPHTHDLVCATVAKDPLISSAPLERQIQTIILPALSVPRPLLQNTEQRPMLFIIDGLDECVDPISQISIIRSFVSSLAIARTAIRYKILIVSRPESQIVSAFDAHDIAPYVHHLCLDEWETIADIAIYLRDKLDEVKQTHPLKSELAEQWPWDESFKRLLDKSFESFAYATSAVRYISSHDRHPDKSLNDLLSLAPSRAYAAYAELDLLYRHILKSLEENTLHIVLKFLCISSLLDENETKVQVISRIIDEEAPSVRLALIKMSSVIRLKEDEVTYHHTSFSEFLRAKERSGDLYLYSPKVGTAVAEVLISRFWNHPAPSDGDDYDPVGNMVRNFDNIAVDMQIVILETFVATPLPSFFVTVHPYIGDFFKLIERNSRSDSEHLPTVISLLFCQAFKHLAMWLSSLVIADAGIGSLEAIANTCFIPSLQSRTFPPTTPGHILSNLVRKSDDPWCTIRRVLPAHDSWEICISLLKIYLNMSRHHRLCDLTRRRFKQTYLHGDLSLTGILIGVLQSELANADICHTLEQILSKAISDFPGKKGAQSLITLSLSQDTADPTKVFVVNDECAPIAEAMNLYIRKTHAELDLTYVSANVKKLYRKRR